MSDHSAVIDILQERGFLAQASNLEGLKEKLKVPQTFYIGFDPTADSLHIGHYIQLMTMAHMQQAGHKPIALVGGGTAMIGDPSGRTDMRQVLSPEQIEHNASKFREQMALFIDFGDDKAELVNNADWLLGLEFIPFMRDIGAHFSVNRMLTAEAYKRRLEKGLTFLEFTYMLLQGYDFLELYRKHGVTLQIGGDDQWSNILAGVDLVRRKEQDEAFGLTIALLTTSTGEKMGKTAKGAVWLDPEKFPIFDFYQYLRNIDDNDVIMCLKLMTFIPLAEIQAMAKWEGQELNRAKEILAFEVTKLVHGEAAAQEAAARAKTLFSGQGSTEDLPENIVDRSKINDLTILDYMSDHKLVPSRSEGRRLIQQGGVYLNEEAITDIGRKFTEDDFVDGEAMLRRGKKNHYRLVLK